MYREEHRLRVFENKQGAEENSWI